MKFEIIKELHQSISIAYAIKNFWQKFTLFYICLRLRRRNPILPPLPFFWGGMRWRKIERIFLWASEAKSKRKRKTSWRCPLPRHRLKRRHCASRLRWVEIQRGQATITFIPNASREPDRVKSFFVWKIGTKDEGFLEPNLNVRFEFGTRKVAINTAKKRKNRITSKWKRLLEREKSNVEGFEPFLEGPIRGDTFEVSSRVMEKSFKVLLSPKKGMTAHWERRGKNHFPFPSSFVFFLWFV